MTRCNFTSKYKMIIIRCTREDVHLLWMLEKMYIFSGSMYTLLRCFLVTHILYQNRSLNNTIVVQNFMGN